MIVVGVDGSEGGELQSADLHRRRQARARRRQEPVLGSVSQQVVQHATCPVLVANEP